MWRWRRVAVARVFALVVRCRIIRLLLYSRVGKNRDTRRGSPAGAGAGRTAGHLAVLFSQKVLAVRRGNDIYRPVSSRLIINIILWIRLFKHISDTQPYSGIFGNRIYRWEPAIFSMKFYCQRLYLVIYSTKCL